MMIKNREPDDEGILGSYLVFCGKIEPLTLNENNIFGAESILWNESSTEFEYTISSPGKYWVEVSYANGCVLKETLEITLLDDVRIDLGAANILFECVSIRIYTFTSST